MIHAKLRHIIESNSSEEGVSSCSSVAGDEIHDSGVPGSFRWFRSEEATQRQFIPYLIAHSAIPRVFIARSIVKGIV